MSKYSNAVIKAAEKYGVIISKGDTEPQIWGRVNKARKAGAAETAAALIAGEGTKKAAREKARYAIETAKQAKEAAEVAYREALAKKRETASNLAECRAVLTAVNKTKVADTKKAEKAAAKQAKQNAYIEQLKAKLAAAIEESGKGKVA